MASVCRLFTDGCMNVKEKEGWMVLSNTVVHPVSLFPADQTRDVSINLYVVPFLYSIFPIYIYIELVNCVF